MTALKPEPARERHWVCAQRLRERRRTLGLTQREVVGRLARIGTHTTNRTLSAMENGRGLDLGMLPDLAETLECTVTYLLGLSSNPQSWQPDGIRSPARQAQPMMETFGHATGVLGPGIPAGFAAPGRYRQPNGFDGFDGFDGGELS